MIAERIKELREKAGLSQAALAKKLDVTRSSVNAWEMGLSTPTTQFVVALCRQFHVSADYLLGLDSSYSLSLEGYAQDEIGLLFEMIKYFDSRKNK